jgi:nucleotide-binding universal stress UspA family protein
MKIMVTLDGSNFPEAVVEPAAKLARKANAEVFLVQVIDPQELYSTISGIGDPEETILEEYGSESQRVPEVSPDIGLPGVVEYSDQAVERVTSEAEYYLRQIGQRFAPLSTEVVVVVGDDVDQELARVATEYEVDLIAMASHGRRGLARLVMGSHAEHLMLLGIAPVLVVRPPDLRHH